MSTSNDGSYSGSCVMYDGRLRATGMRKAKWSREFGLVSVWSGIRAQWRVGQAGGSGDYIIINVEGTRGIKRSIVQVIGILCPAVSISENYWGPSVKFMIFNSILTMQRHRPNVKIVNYWGPRTTPKEYKLTPMLMCVSKRCIRNRFGIDSRRALITSFSPISSPKPSHDAEFQQLGVTFRKFYPEPRS